MNDNIHTWTVVVMYHGGWGCGNTYAEAVSNSRHLNVKKDEHILVLFTKPVVNVNAGFHGLSYKWADEEGTMAYTTIANGLQEVLS